MAEVIESGVFLRFRVTLNDTTTFYKMVRWLNANAGHGKTYWTTNGRILKHLKKGKSPTVEVIVSTNKVTPTAVMAFMKKI